MQWLLIIAVIGGLAGSTLHMSTAGAASPDSRDAVMLVLLRQFSFRPRVDDIKDEATTIKCIGDSIRRHRPGQRIISFDEFQSTAFPRLTRSTAPKRPQFLELMLRDADFRRRIQPFNLRYIAFIGGVTETSKASGGGICVIGAGCFIVRSWDKNSRIGAKILDVERVKAVAETRTEAAGRSWFALIGILPMGGTAGTEIRVCQDLGAKIAGFLSKDRTHIPMLGVAAKGVQANAIPRDKR